MKILVSHSGKQYVHQLIHGVSKVSNVIFLTSYWYKPESFPFTLLRKIPFPGKVKVFHQLAKRYYSPIEHCTIKVNPVPEFIRIIIQIVRKRYNNEIPIFNRDRQFDKWAAKKVSKHKPDIVIGYEMTCLDTFKAAKKNGAITVLDLAQIHFEEIKRLGNKFPEFGKLYKNQSFRNTINLVKDEELKLADYIFCLSEFAKESLIKNGIPQKKIRKVNIGFDPTIFKPKKIYGRDHNFRFVFVGTITRRKGIDILIKAFSKLKLENAELLLVGPATDAADMLSQQVPGMRHIPYADHESLNELLNDSDVFVFPSYLDSWAMVVIEAMACGLPVVVSKYTGAADAVGQGGGFVIEPDLDQLMEKMKFFYEHPDEVENYGRIARKIAENYTWENYHSSVKNAILEMTPANFGK